MSPAVPRGLLRARPACPRFRIMRASFVLLMFFSLCTAPAVAQSGTQAVFTGFVVDEDREPLHGVLVTVFSPTAMHSPQAVVTDERGAYRFHFLAPADDYELTAEVTGFATVLVSPIVLDPGSTTRQDITLQPASSDFQTLSVSARGSIVDTVGTKIATVFNYEFIEGLPSLGRSYQDYLTLAPGVTDIDQDGNPNVNGSRRVDFETRLDGVNLRDPASGTFGLDLNLESLAEIEVITAGAPAEFGRAQGGFGNIVSKTGGNDFEIAFKAFYRSDLFDNDGANNSDVLGSTESLDGFEDFRPFLSLGGPIWKDRLWFYLSGEYIDTEVPVNTLTGTGLRTAEGWNGFGKLTVQPGVNHQLTFSAVGDDRSFNGLNLRATVDPDSDFEWDQGGYSAWALWRYTISPSVLLEMTVATFDTGIEIRPVTDPRRNPDCTPDRSQCNPFTEDLYTLQGSPGTITGPYFYSQDDDRKRYSFRTDVSFYVDDFGGSHSLKTGFEYAREEYENTSTTRPIRINELSTGGSGPGGGGSGLTGTITFLEAFPEAFGDTACIPTGGGDSVCRESPVLEADKDVFSFYVHDSFRPLSNLTLNIGLRFDREEVTTDGFTPVDPRQEASEFLALHELGTGRTIEEEIQDRTIPNQPPPSFGQVYADLLQQPRIQFDLNGDHKDANHCGTDFGALNLYNNSLVIGFGVNPNGTYFLVGDESVDDNNNGIPDFHEPDDEAEDFFQFLDVAGSDACLGGPNSGQPCDLANGNADCPFAVCGAPDGTVGFDPGLVGQVITIAGNYADPTQCTGSLMCDIINFVPAGNATGATNGDGQVQNPNCDRISEDTAFLFQVFSRHQFDLVEGPIDFAAPIPGYDNGCSTTLSGSGLPLPGTCRQRETFDITNNNLAPRLSISWDPWSDNKTKIFASWSRFYDSLFLASVVPEFGPDIRATVYDAGQLDDGINARPSQTGRFQASVVDRDLETPYTDEWTVGFERELVPDWSLGLTYIHRDGRNQLQDLDSNHFVQDADGDGMLDDDFGAFEFGSGGNPGGGGPGPSIIVPAPDGLPDLFAWNPLFSQVLRIGNSSSSEYWSYQLTVKHRLSHNWEMQGSYAYSEAKGDGEGFLQTLGNEPGSSNAIYGNSDFDQTHVVKFQGVTHLRAGQRLGWAIQWGSGTPYSQVIRRISADNLNSVTLRTGFPSGQRNDQRNEGIWDVDVSYRKDFRIAKGGQGFVGVEVDNLLNSDDLRIIEVFDQSVCQAGCLNATRKFGRRWQFSLGFSF